MSQREPEPGSLGWFRARQGVTQEELAFALGKTRQAVQQTERRPSPGVPTVVAYLEALGGRVDFSVTFPDGSVYRLL